MAQALDLFSLLKADHREVQNILEDIIESLQEEESTDFDLVRKMRSELELHMRLEEQLLYPKAEQVVALREQIRHAYQEHEEVKSLLSKIREDLEIDNLESALQDILRLLKDHIQEEENRLFPALEREWEERAVNDLGLEFQDRKKRELSR